MPTSQVIAWAREQAGADQLYAVALVVDDRFWQRGLVWLLGDELPNIDPDDLTDLQQQRLDAMSRRRDEYRTAHSGS